MKFADLINAHDLTLGTETGWGKADLAGPAMMLNEVEEQTRRCGREIFARLDRHGPVLFTPSWWDDKLMGLGMHDPALKVQLFRFVDTLPYLRTGTDISRHLREYLNEARADLPGWIRRGLPWIPDGGPLSGVLAFTARKGAERMARRFIAGSNVPEAVAAVTAMRARRLAFTIDLLGEATVTEAEADHVQKQYLDLLAGLTREVNRLPEEPLVDCDDRGPIPRVNVSIKLSALFSQFDPIDPAGTSRSVLKRLRPILRRARETGAFVNFDMEQYSFKDATLRIFCEVLTEPEFRDWPHVGIAIQAYLRDTERDLADLRDWAHERGTPVWVRLVKGAYWDYETVIAAQQGWPVPVWTQKWESDANYERCTDFLLSNVDWLVPAFGSHNVRSLAHALASAERLGVPRRRFEIQMLYGMADPIKEAIQSLGYRVRIYTPYGQLLPGMAYLVRRLLENSSNDSFLRASFAEAIPEEELLMNPHSKTWRAGDVSPPRVGMADAMLGNADAMAKQADCVEWDHTRGTDVPRSPGFRNEPLSDFSRESARLAMQEALREVRSQFGKTYSPVIANHEVMSPNLIEVRNPSRTIEVLGHIAAASKEQAVAAIEASSAAFDSWRDTPIAERVGLLRRVAQQFRERRFELAAWACIEAGKPWREADADIAEAIDFCEYYAAEMQRLANPQRRDVPGEENAYFYEPRGVAVVIAPWNFPLAILTGMTTAALVAGNTVIMKPAEQSSIIAAKFMECLQAAGAPRGVVNFLPGRGEEIGPTLVNHPEVAIIAFTGSLKVGLLINEQAARTPGGQTHVKRVIAEMGGKNAIIVDADADLDEAVRGVIDSAFGYAGQKCSAGSRAIVLADIYDTFLARLVEAARSLTVAAADDAGCAVGPVIDAEARDRILRMIEKGKSEARLAFAADLGELANQGYFVGPHVFADVPENASIAQEEIFGPVLAVMKAKDLDDAIRFANGTPYALTGGIYSRSPKNLERVRRRFRVGNLYVNRRCTGALVDRQPFGGFKLSGIGSKAGGPDYLLQFLLPRTITENTMRRGFAPSE